jgi:ribosome maturation factor RimP
MSNSSAGRRLVAILTPAVERVGLDLEDVEMMSAGKRRVVQVLIDKDGGVSLDDVALASQSISAVLDADPAADAALGSAPYVLEVSSPGVERPLLEPRHWRRARGRLVRAPLVSGGEITGRVVDADADGVRFAGDASDDRVLAFDELGPGRVQVEFNRAPVDESAQAAHSGEAGSVDDVDNSSPSFQPEESP